ncbi:phosphopantothenoylcysteine decarboxylase-like [Lingula anatina]|uniref:Phosphopantothenoylcysteine decarboxylase n=1 Tax=Lingula anatina TaxID=7574 RepID=A0A1S3JM50_LINAN|nr:phosphopantothenoylcysteine decarboxylase-like [Lingula anatina]|eukprot:XP_013411463.1 phosphopantothenoylcysteine decarboxylase-like [Lingula anatina]
MDRGNPLHILVGCTGSVASIKIPKLVTGLKSLQANVDKKTCEVSVEVVATDHACHFFNPNEVDVKVHRDADEWRWQKRGDPVLHIELRRWADILIVAPLDANTLAKMANGICDNLLTCIIRAWDTDKPLLVAPAMNTYMWDHPHTARHIQAVEELGCTVIPCISKQLICGDSGLGAMAEVSSIVEKVEEVFIARGSKT